jgi:hypothetical protein
MNNKTSLILLAGMVGAVTLLGWKMMTLPSPGAGSDTDSVISLSTTPNPLRLGQATFVISVKDKNGKLVDDATVTFDINMTTMNMGTQQGVATSQGDGLYKAVGNMSMRGPWRVRAKVKMPNGRTENKDFVVNVP